MCPQGHRRQGLAPRIPVVAAVEPGRDGFQPSHPMTTSFANISPNPSMTPFTNGRSMLIAREEKRAVRRVLVDSELSNIVKVADSGAGGGTVCTCEGEGVSVRSGYVIDGKDDVTEAWTSSHFEDSSPVSGCESGA